MSEPSGSLKVLAEEFGDMLQRHRDRVPDTEQCRSDLLSCLSGALAGFVARVRLDHGDEAGLDWLKGGWNEVWSVSSELVEHLKGNEQ